LMMRFRNASILFFKAILFNRKGGKNYPQNIILILKKFYCDSFICANLPNLREKF
jgi:hypothetical protein